MNLLSKLGDQYDRSSKDYPLYVPIELMSIFSLTLIVLPLIFLLILPALINFDSQVGFDEIIISVIFISAFVFGIIEEGWIIKNRKSKVFTKVYAYWLILSIILVVLIICSFFYLASTSIH